MGTASEAAPVSRAHAVANRVAAEFANKPVIVTPVSKGGVERIYVALTTSAKDHAEATKIGGSWYIDLSSMEWTQKRDWISEGTSKTYSRLVASVQDSVNNQLISIS